MANSNKKVPRRNMKSEKKIKFKFDIWILNVIIKYCSSQYISKSYLANLYKFISYVNIESYNSPSEIDIYERLKFIETYLDFAIKENIQDKELLLSFTKEKYPQAENIIESINMSDKLSYSDTEAITKFIKEKLDFIEVYLRSELLIKHLEKIRDADDYHSSHYDLMQTIKDELNSLLLGLNNSANNIDGQLLREFSFSDPNAINTLSTVVDNSKKPSAILQTGIRQLNAILSPGFRGGRLYTIIGGTGKFKSGTLLNIADQIRLFNPQIIPYENGLRKCILFVTLENSIEETIERLYDMYAPMEAEFRNESIDSIINTLREEGRFIPSSSSDGIDICFYYAGNLEISTADLYKFTRRLYNKGLKPICCIVDYLKRIDSEHDSNGDERVRLSYATKELKNFAQFYQIPVITAMQLNREGNSIIDAAVRDSKQDVARFVGTSMVGVAWDIIEDSDWVCLINLELQKSTQKLFLTFKRLKIRGKKIPFASEYFNHPFINSKNIRLEPDVDKSSTISIVSLANDLESIQEDDSSKENNKNNMQQRLTSKKASPNILTQLKGVSTSDLLS